MLKWHRNKKNKISAIQTVTTNVLKSTVKYSNESLSKTSKVLETFTAKALVEHLRNPCRYTAVARAQSMKFLCFMKEKKSIENVLHILSRISIQIIKTSLLCYTLKIIRSTKI